MARKLGVDPSNYNKIENGNIKPNNTVFKGVLRELGIVDHSEEWYSLVRLIVVEYLPQGLKSYGKEVLGLE